MFVAERPNDSVLFEQLVDGVTQLPEASPPFFQIDNVQYAYPEEPDNLRIMGNGVLVLADASGRNADGKIMHGTSYEPDSVKRMVVSYLFKERVRQQYGRIGELVIAGRVEALGVRSFRTDLYWLNVDGSVTTRKEAQLDSNNMPPSEEVIPIRQLNDFELEAVKDIVWGAVPARNSLS